MDRREFIACMAALGASVKKVGEILAPCKDVKADVKPITPKAEMFSKYDLYEISDTKVLNCPDFIIDGIHVEKHFSRFYDELTNVTLGYCKEANPTVTIKGHFAKREDFIPSIPNSCLGNYITIKNKMWDNEFCITGLVDYIRQDFAYEMDGVEITLQDVTAEWW